MQLTHRAKDQPTSVASQPDVDGADDKQDRRRPTLRSVLVVLFTLTVVSVCSFRFGIVIGAQREHSSQVEAMEIAPRPRVLPAARAARPSVLPAARAARPSVLPAALIASSAAASSFEPQLTGRQQQQQQQHYQQLPAASASLVPPPVPPPPPGPEALSEVPAAADNMKQTCLSFNREMCPPLNLSIQTPEQQKQTHKRCATHVALERVFQKATKARFCGRRLPRLNPCWIERGTTSCLPHFFILGEMKCGTTSLYHFLRKHPRVVVPRVKEPRFLQPGRFPQTSVSRYKVNFDVAVPLPDAVTFDASPVYLRSPIAREWLSKWMPDARLIVLVRNPVQVRAPPGPPPSATPPHPPAPTRIPKVQTAGTLLNQHRLSPY